MKWETSRAGWDEYPLGTLARDAETDSIWEKKAIGWSKDGEQAIELTPGSADQVCQPEEVLMVRLDYFKPNGKWYGEGYYETSHRPLFSIWQDVREMLRVGTRPGLVDSESNEFNVLVSVPKHEHAHPHMVMAESVVSS